MNKYFQLTEQHIGKKVRCGYWRASSYFVPYGFYENFHGNKRVVGVSYGDCHPTPDQSNPDDNWEFYQEASPEPEFPEVEEKKDEIRQIRNELSALLKDYVDARKIELISLRDEYFNAMQSIDYRLKKLEGKSCKT